METTNHLFVLYEVTFAIWYKMLRWVERRTFVEVDLKGFFQLFQDFGVGKKESVGLVLTWRSLFRLFGICEIFYFKHDRLTIIIGSPQLSI